MRSPSRAPASRPVGMPLGQATCRRVASIAGEKQMQSSGQILREPARSPARGHQLGLSQRLELLKQEQERRQKAIGKHAVLIVPLEKTTEVRESRRRF